MKLVQEATSLRKLREQLQQSRNQDEPVFISESTLQQVLQGLGAENSSGLANALWLLSVLPLQTLRDAKANEAIASGLQSVDPDIVMTAAWSSLVVGAELELDIEAVLAANRRLGGESPEEQQAGCFLTGAAWMLASQAEAYATLSAFLSEPSDKKLTRSQLRTLAEVDRLPAATLERVRGLATASESTTQRLSIRVIGRHDATRASATLLEAACHDSDDVVAAEARLARERLRIRKTGCANRRYCANVSSIADRETTPAERIYAATESAVDQCTAPLREQIRNAARSILDTERQWLDQATDAERSALLNRLTHLLAPFSVEVTLDPKSDPSGETEVAQSGDTQVVEPDSSVDASVTGAISNPAAEFEQELTHGTEFSDLASLCAAIASEPLFEMEKEFQILGSAVRKMRTDRVTVLVDSVNRILASLEGRKLTKEYADRFVTQVRDMVAALGCQLFLDGRPVTFSVSKDSRYQAARFAIREIGVSNKSRSATSASALPRFSLRFI